MARHLHELACHLQIHMVHLVKIGQILIEYLGDADVAYLYFVFGQKHQNEAQRAFKVLHLLFCLDDPFQMEARILH